MKYDIDILLPALSAQTGLSRPRLVGMLGGLQVPLAEAISKITITPDASPDILQLFQVHKVIPVRVVASGRSAPRRFRYARTG